LRGVFMNDHTRTRLFARHDDGPPPHVSALLWFTTCALVAACSGSVARDAEAVGGSGARDGGVAAPDGVPTPDTNSGRPPGPAGPANPPPDGANGDGSQATPTGVTPSMEPASGTKFTRVRRLSNREYNNTVRDLLG